MDPFFLAHVARANAEIATALENMSPDEPAYEEKREALLAIQAKIELLIAYEVMGLLDPSPRPADGLRFTVSLEDWRATLKDSQGQKP